MPLTLSLRDLGAAAPLAIDLGGVVPQVVRDLDASAIARLEVRADGEPVRLGDVASIGGSPGDGTIECLGDFARVHQVAAGMTSGAIVVRGSVGRHAGAGMTGGTLTVEGSAGDWLAAEMIGGSIHVAGDAGDGIAGAFPGSEHGMRGGLVVVCGSVGSLAGMRLRRGIVAVGGDCGDAPAFEMRAGTVVVGGRIGSHPGLGMRRGSLVALSDTPAPPPTFVRGADWSPAFLPLVLQRLARAGLHTAAEGVHAGCWRQWHGDGLTGGRGEILHRV